MLNRTNNRTIRSAYGDDTAGWTGQLIVLFPTQAEYRGRIGPALRVRIPPPKQAAKLHPAEESSRSVPKAEPEQEILDEFGDEVPY